MNPVVDARLSQLADEFTAAAIVYENAAGSRNEMLAFEMRRGAAQLRAVRALVANGAYSATHGVMWIRAAWRIISVVGRSNA